jgi:hypothetical protein
MDIAFNIFLCAAGVILYGSGLLIWPIHRWIRRKRQKHGKALGIVFLIQVVVYCVIAYLANFHNEMMEISYEWALLWIMFNILFTFVGIWAWVFDVRYEHSLDMRPAA